MESNQSQPVALLVANEPLPVNWERLTRGFQIEIYQNLLGEHKNPDVIAIILGLSPIQLRDLQKLILSRQSYPLSYEQLWAFLSNNGCTDGYVETAMIATNWWYFSLAIDCDWRQHATSNEKRDALTFLRTRGIDGGIVDIITNELRKTSTPPPSPVLQIITASKKDDEILKQNRRINDRRCELEGENNISDTRFSGGLLIAYPKHDLAVKSTTRGEKSSAQTWAHLHPWRSRLRQSQTRSPKPNTEAVNRHSVQQAQESESDRPRKRTKTWQRTHQQSLKASGSNRTTMNKVQRRIVLNETPPPTSPLSDWIWEERC